MPVSEWFKEKTRRRVDTWKEKMLTKYSPEGFFGDIDLSNFTIIHQNRHMTSPTLPKASLHVHLVTNESKNVQLVILKYPTIWDADDANEMLDHNIEVAIFDRDGQCFTTIIPHYIFLGCFGDNATQIETASGWQYYIDRYYHRVKEQAPKLEVIDKWPQIVVRDENEILWAAEDFGNYQMSFKNMEGNEVIYAKQIPVWKRLLRPDNIGPRMKLDVLVKEDIPKEIVLFLASKSV